MNFLLMFLIKFRDIKKEIHLNSGSSKASFHLTGSEELLNLFIAVMKN